MFMIRKSVTITNDIFHILQERLYAALPTSLSTNNWEQGYWEVAENANEDLVSFLWFPLFPATVAIWSLWRLSISYEIPIVASNCRSFDADTTCGSNGKACSFWAHWSGKNYDVHFRRPPISLRGTFGRYKMLLFSFTDALSCLRMKRTYGRTS